MKKIIVLLGLGMALQVNAQTEISSKYDEIGKFHNGIAIVRLHGLEGAINSEGKEVIKPEWDALTSFGRDGIGYAHKKDLVGLIDKSGTLIAQPIYQRIGHFKYGKAVVMKDGKKGIMDINGNIIIEPKYDKLKMENGVIIASENGQDVLLKAEK